MKRKEKNGYKPTAAAPAPESASAPAPYRHSFGRELPDFSSRQEVHHRLIALFHGKQLRDLHVSASARFPACHLSHRFPECFLLVSTSSFTGYHYCTTVSLVYNGKFLLLPYSIRYELTQNGKPKPYSNVNTEQPSFQPRKPKHLYNATNTNMFFTTTAHLCSSRKAKELVLPVPRPACR
jgi:hypothetical protein